MRCEDMNILRNANGMIFELVKVNHCGCKISIPESIYKYGYTTMKSVYIKEIMNNNIVRVFE